MPPSIQPTIANSYFIVDPTPNIKSFSVLSLQSVSSIPASLVPSSKTPTHYYLPPTTPISLLSSSPAYSDIKQLNSKFNAFIKWL